MDIAKDISPLSPVDIQVSHVEHKRTGSNETKGTSIFAETGPTIDRSKTREAFTKSKSSNPGLTWPRIRHALREPFSEFMGTFILIMFGDGVVAQVVLSNGEKGDYQSISWGWVSGRVIFSYSVIIADLTDRDSVSCSVCTHLASLELTSTLPLLSPIVSFASFLGVSFQSTHSLKS